jgi:hypothetical protein
VKSLYKKLTISIVGTIFLVLGCGLTPSPHPTKTNVATSTKTITSKTIWIEYARYTASQVHQNPTYWVLTSKQVNNVGQYLGAIDSSPLNSSGWHSNVLSIGTKFFVIPGTPMTRAFAVQMKNGTYIEATLVGSKKPTKSSDIPNNSATVTATSVKVHSYTSVDQAVNAINTIQQEFGQFNPSGPNVNLGSGITAEFSGGTGQSSYKWTEGRWTILARFWGASAAGQKEAQQIVSYLHTHMLPVPQNDGIITVSQPTSSLSPTDCNTTVAWQDGSKVQELKQTGDPIRALQTAVNHG